MNVNVKIDSRALEKSLGEFKGQMPFILMKTINDTMIDAQKSVISRANDVFTIRRQQFLKQSMKITKFAKKDDLTGVFEVADIGNSKTADVFEKFQVGGNKRPFRSSNVAIPTTFIKPTASRVISKTKKPSLLKNSFRGKTKSGADAIYQRKGKGKKETVRVAYVLKPSVRIDKRLRFNETGLATINRQFNINADRAISKALSTAKLK